MASQVLENQSWQNRQRTVRTILTPQGGSGITQSDFFAGTDTYGWPPSDDPSSQEWTPSFSFAQRGNLQIVTPNIVGATIPDVTGIPISAATAALSFASFASSATGAYNNSWPVGIVFLELLSNGSNAAGQTQPIGTTVYLTYSLGPAPAPACLPPATQQAGWGGDIWGASGGAATPVNAAIPLVQALSTSSQPANALDAAPNRSVLSEMADGALPGSTNACTVPDAPQVG